MDSECGLCDGMRICQCQKVDNRRFIAACHAMQGMLAGGWNVMELGVVQQALTMADALLEELERK